MHTVRACLVRLSSDSSEQNGSVHFRRNGIFFQKSFSPPKILSKCTHLLYGVVKWHRIISCTEISLLVLVELFNGFRLMLIRWVAHPMIKKTAAATAAAASETHHSDTKCDAMWCDVQLYIRSRSEGNRRYFVIMATNFLNEYFVEYACVRACVRLEMSKTYQKVAFFSLALSLFPSIHSHVVKYFSIPKITSLANVFSARFLSRSRPVGSLCVSEIYNTCLPMPLLFGISFAVAVAIVSNFWFFLFFLVYILCVCACECAYNARIRSSYAVVIWFVSDENFYSSI